MRKNPIFPVLRLLSFLSCNKDDGYQRAFAIHIPDIGDMIISPVDTIIEGGYYLNKSIDLDVDKDSLPDIRLSSNILGSPGIGEHPEVRLASLKSEAKFFGKISNDTTFAHNSITSFQGDNNTVIIYNSTTYSCRKLAPADTVFNVVYDNFRISKLWIDSTISISGTFASDTCLLTNDWMSYPGSPVFDNDTIFYYTSSRDDSCYGFPEGEVCYIGFRMDTGNEQKLGWLKIKINDSFRITVLETAIQK
jgi:hypothetical protein